MDKLTKEQRRKNMQAIKSTGSKIETRLAKALFALGYRYRKNDKTIFGKPDITFKRLRIAVFIDSEFWHGKDWPAQKQKHKSNVEYWYPKIEKNIQRDKLVNKTLHEDGWIVLRFWGTQVQKELNYCIQKTEELIHKQKAKAL